MNKDNELEIISVGYASNISIILIKFVSDLLQLNITQRC